MRRTLLVVAGLGLAALALRGCGCRSPGRDEPEHQAALAVAIAADVAAERGHYTAWHVSSDATSTVLWQAGHAVFEGGLHGISIETPSWKLHLDPRKVFRVTCHLAGGDVGGYPLYGSISFQGEDGSVWDQLFSADFQEPDIDAFRRICAKHGLEVHG